MSASTASQTKLHIIGAGCAGMSLAARAAELPDHRITITPDHGVAPDHIWGFWKAADLADAASLARHSWPAWQIITADGAVTLTSADRPYMALQRSQWISACAARLDAAGVNRTSTPDADAQIIDSRPPAMPDDAMIQHFIGWEISAPAGSFDPTTAILMDFRCDQSRGLHFIYLLPFSDRDALVESTFFSPQIEDDNVYETAIATYLAEICAIADYTVQRTEKGAIPMAELSPVDPSVTAIGANGGAIRPSSGYAFVFIQRQISAAIARAKKAPGPVQVTRPHKALDLWMDKVFLTVLRRWPARAPYLFLRMASVLTGDEFARFMGGEADMRLRLKVVMAMPKWPFIRALCAVVTGTVSRSGSPDVAPRRA